MRTLCERMTALLHLRRALRMVFEALVPRESETGWEGYEEYEGPAIVATDLQHAGLELVSNVLLHSCRS